MAAPPKQLGSICWNCDEAAIEAIEVTLQAPAGPGAAVRLCQPCFILVCLPLVADGQIGAPEPGGQRSLLVVDDDATIRKLLATIFRGHGFSVVTAYDTSFTAEELGVQAFLPKPLSVATLVATVDSLVGPRPPTILA